MSAFLEELATIARPVGGGAYAFLDDVQSCRGWVQIIVNSDHRITIHRLWTLKAGKGNGSAMLRAVCALADRHAVELALKALPFGRKPFAMTGDQLQTWYERHGFSGTRRKLIRRPMGQNRETRE